MNVAELESCTQSFGLLCRTAKHFEIPKRRTWKRRTLLAPSRHLKLEYYLACSNALVQTAEACYVWIEGCLTVVTIGPQNVAQPREVKQVLGPHHGPQKIFCHELVF